MIFRVSFFTIFLLMTYPASTAEFSFEGTATDHASITVSTFRLEGEIVQGDAGKFRKLFKSSHAPSSILSSSRIELNSPGGSYIEGLELAKTFRQLGISTLVRTGESCYSACALAFLGGSEPLKDPTTETEFPNQLPERSLERGAELGFHAPYLDIPSSSYNADTVQMAYRVAIDSVAALIQIADHLYVEPAELPRLLNPDKSSFYVADTVDATRMLWIDYADNSLQFRDLKGITPSMVANACVNRWYHIKRRSALPGYEIAKQTRENFEEGSELLENGEQGLSFGVRSFRQNAMMGWLAFTPIKMTDDGKEFVWCLFEGGNDMPHVYYRNAGTVDELFEPYKKRGQLWDLTMDDHTMNPERGLSISSGMLKVSDTAPANVKLTEVKKVIDEFLSKEEVIN